MKNTIRLLAAITVLLTGMAFLPIVGLPAQGFNWERYAQVYMAMVEINHPSGSPGSFFTLTGTNFAPNSTVNIYVNDIFVGIDQSDSQGNLTFILDTTGADPGYYQVRVAGTRSATTQFRLDPDEPQWPQEGTDKVIAVPAGVGWDQILFPAILH